MPEQITQDGLDGCREALNVASLRLDERLKSIADRLIAKSKMALSSPEDAADLERLQAEWETARLCLNICSQANESVTKANINVFGNVNGAEEVLQFFASTTGRDSEATHAVDTRIMDLPSNKAKIYRVEDAKLRADAHDFMVKYTRISSDEIDAHVRAVDPRQIRAVHPYPCVGSLSFLDLNLQRRRDLFARIVKTLTAPASPDGSEPLYIGILLHPFRRHGGST
ncbi:hypothetical protein B0H63DRAFT_518443 [Podospora didyma]|uniref:Fungal N-terminal domain-containing protein n=1 Tax=Podospora didyma TaxID=330526 RepID=A0AAE0NWT5_9PEZI|nr:hypothetical protein B0H63DRAFT_518443 [Podospora didyma]